MTCTHAPCNCGGVLFPAFVAGAFEDEPTALKEPIVGAVLLLRDVKVRRGLLLLQLDGVRVVS